MAPRTPPASLDVDRLNAEAAGIWRWEGDDLELRVVDGELRTFSATGRDMTERFSPFEVMLKSRKVGELPDSAKDRENT